MNHILKKVVAAVLAVAVGLCMCIIGDYYGSGEILNAVASEQEEDTGINQDNWKEKLGYKEKDGKLVKEKIEKENMNCTHEWEKGVSNIDYDFCIDFLKCRNCGYLTNNLDYVTCLENKTDGTAKYTLYAKKCPFCANYSNSMYDKIFSPIKYFFKGVINIYECKECKGIKTESVITKVDEYKVDAGNYQYERTIYPESD